MSMRNLRLELAKIVYTHGIQMAEAIGRCRELEKYILESNLEIESTDKVEALVQQQEFKLNTGRKVVRQTKQPVA